MTDAMRKLLVENDEDLALWHTRTGLSLEDFIREHRTTIDGHIRTKRDQPKT